MFTPQNTGRLISLPFNIAAIRTNCRVWLLDDQEKAELAESGSVCLNEWVSVHPKYVSLVLFSFSLVTVTLAKLAMWEAVKESLRLQPGGGDGAPAAGSAAAAAPAGAPAPAAPTAPPQPPLTVPAAAAAPIQSAPPPPPPTEPVTGLTRADLERYNKMGINVTAAPQAVVRIA